jgi:hypothetical protein
MSIVNTSNLIPSNLYGKSVNDEVSIEITPNGIVLGGDLTTTPITATISQSGISTTNPTGFDILSSLNMNSNAINNISSINGISLNDFGINSTAQIILTSSDNVVMNSTGLQVNASDFITLTANNDFMTFTADDDITLTSNSMGVKINGGNGDGGNNDIVLTTNSGTLIGNIICQSGGDIQLNAPSAVISINSGDNTQITCGENFTIQTNSSTGLVILNTGDLSNSGGVKWNNYSMSITFFNKWNGGFSYNNAGNWEMVKQNTISFPTQFLYGTWAVSFSINCSNVGSAPADKGLAIFFNFLDATSNTYNGFSYNQSFPYANWFQPSTYTNTSQTPLSITYTDYFDFTGAVNNLELQLNWYADNAQTQNDFFVSTTFTLMTLI